MRELEEKRERELQEKEKMKLGKVNPSIRFEFHLGKANSVLLLVIGVKEEKIKREEQQRRDREDKEKREKEDKDKKLKDDDGNI